MSRLHVRSPAIVVLLPALFLGHPDPGEAQRPNRAARVGVLSPFSPDDDAFLATLRGSLRELGYREGEGVVLEYRSARGRSERLTGLAADLVGLKVDVIVTTTPPAVQAARRATTTIPIVAGGVDDAVNQGFVASLARPGGNVTGVSWLNTELSAKRLEILKEAIPRLSRVAVIREAVAGATSLEATESAAHSLGIRLDVLELRTADEIPSTFASMVRSRVGAVVVLSGPMILSQERQIVDLALRMRLPTIFPDDRSVRIGGLLSYGPRLVDIYRRAAIYVDRILKGATPGDLPVEEPTQFQLGLNMKTARALGLTLPQAILLRADGIIQ